MRRFLGAAAAFFLRRFLGAAAFLRRRFGAADAAFLRRRFGAAAAFFLRRFGAAAAFLRLRTATFPPGDSSSLLCYRKRLGKSFHKKTINSRKKCFF